MDGREDDVRAGRGAVAVTLGLISACVTAAPPARITLPHPTARPVAHVSAVMNDDVALATIAAVAYTELGLPALPVTYHFFPRPDAFAAVLIENGHEPAVAREAAGRLRAIAGHGHVLLNDSRLSTEWGDRMFTFTHEFAHCLQYALAGGRRGTSHQWLREGFADAVAVRVLDRLGALSIQTWRRQRRELFGGSNRRRAPHLDQLATFTDWMGFTARRDLAPEAQAFLATEALIERHGFIRLLDYFAAFETSDDRAANFRAAFGRDLRAFEAEFDASVGIVREEARLRSGRLDRASQWFLP
jgi:hypothetical protein